MLSTSEDLMLRKEGEVFYEACDIRVIQNAKVVAVRPMENVVKTEVGDIFQYDFLVLASGGKPKTLDIAKDIPNVYLLRTPEDGNKIGMRKSCTVLIGNFLDVSVKIYRTASQSLGYLLRGNSNEKNLFLKYFQVFQKNIYIFLKDLDFLCIDFYIP